MKVWGVLAKGRLHTYVLPDGESMTKKRYAWLVEHRMAKWSADAFRDDGAAFVVQDHERALWGEDAKTAMRDHGLRLLENYPKCSQDTACTNRVGGSTVPEATLFPSLCPTAGTEKGRGARHNTSPSSQDLNAVETAWRELRTRLSETMPTRREGRAAFVGRLRRAVAWVNEHRGDYLRDLCTNQKERADDVILAKGGRTKH